jgi:hypothetical protein
MLLACVLMLGCIAMAEETDLIKYDGATPLFNDVYVQYVIGDFETTFDGACIAAETCGYTYEVKEDGTKAITIYADKEKNGDSVWLGFLPSGDGIEMASCISYTSVEKNAEVSWNNLSTDFDPEYDTYKTHLLGEDEAEVGNIDAQAKFLYGINCTAP